MKSNHRKIMAAFGLVMGLGALSPFAFAKKETLKKIAGPTNKERTDYFQCRKKAISDSKKIKGKQAVYAKGALNACRDQFPGTSILIDCKRAALRKHKVDKKALSAALVECRKEYDQRNFNPNAEIPFFFGEGKGFFAGAGLNVPRRMLDPKKEGNSNDFGNYSCNALEKVFYGDGKEEFLLFGNEIAAFAKKEAKKPEIVKQLGLKPAGKEDLVVHPKLGQVYGIKGKEPLAVFFPTSYCHFERKLGDLYESIKVYYLTERDKKFVTPYFGVAFYKPTIATTADDLAANVAKALGDKYKPYKTKKGAIYISSSEVKEFDEEGDPFNVCKAPAQHQFMAMIKTGTQDQANKPEYLILANISNLCKYGSRLVEGQLK